MKQLTKLLALISLVCVLVTANASQAASKQAKKTDFTDPNKVIQVTKKSTVLQLKLKANPTTGYSWFLVNYDRALIQPLGRKYYPAKTSAAGAPGYVIWRFKVLSSAFAVPQLSHIALQYVRPWIVNDEAQKLNFTLAITQ